EPPKGYGFASACRVYRRLPACRERTPAERKKNTPPINLGVWRSKNLVGAYLEVLISTQPNKFYSMHECCNDHLSAGHFRFSPGGAARKRRGRAVYRTRKGRRR